MQLKARPVGTLHTTPRESDIAELSLGLTGLRVVVHVNRRDSDEQLQVEYQFDAPRGFRFLDEGDLLRYWETGVFSGDHHLFEILSGGWIDQECKFPGMLSVTSAVGTFREWFIRTSNGCINVLSVNEPLIREFK
jgi:hypothetical protein